MFRKLLFLLIGLLPTAAFSVENLSDRIAEFGLEHTAQSLSALDRPDASQLFALGGVRFLRAIEKALQTRYRYGLTGETISLPVLRVELATNPDPEPFDTEIMDRIFEAVSADMELARTALSGIGTQEVGVRIELDDLWFDVNMNARRDPFEGIIWLAGESLFPNQMGRGGTPLQIRFDTADAAWLHAYTHLLSGVSDLVLAFPPGPAIEQVTTGAARMNSFFELAPPTNAYEEIFAADVDAAMVVFLAVQQQPRAERTRSARQNFLAMIRENRRFWSLLDLEQDNDAEWIPNARQTSALGVQLPPDIATTWQAILTDAEDLLEGRKLIPHWRYGSAAGINLKRLMEDPIPVEPAEWLQGMGLLDYAEPGERIGFFNWRQFQRMVRGDSMVFVLLLN